MDGVGGLFCNLLLPDVRSVTLDFDPNTWLPLDFLPFIHRSSCPLEKLALLAIKLTSEELMNCLFELPLLRELEIDSVWYWD
jgi:hypothetical protein